MAALSGAWPYRVSSRIGWPGINIMWLVKTARLTNNVWRHIQLFKQLPLWHTLACSWASQQPANRLVGLVVKASISRAEDPGFESYLRRDFSGVESHQWLKHWHSSGYTPGIIGSVLGLVGPVSVYCDLVRWKVWSATSISVWQHVKLSEQICPRDALACCWDVKQPTNKDNNSNQPTHKQPLKSDVYRKKQK